MWWEQRSKDQRLHHVGDFAGLDSSHSFFNQIGDTSRKPGRDEAMMSFRLASYDFEHVYIETAFWGKEICSVSGWKYLGNQMGELAKMTLFLRIVNHIYVFRTRLVGSPMVRTPMKWSRSPKSLFYTEQLELLALA